VGNVIVDDDVAKYDVKVVYSLLLQVYLHLNPMKTKIEPTIVEDDDCFLWAIFFVDDAIMSIMKNELQIFRRLCVKLIETINPLGWWAIHSVKFSHVSLLACHVFGIIGS
jgi:hypothetical protein